MSEKKRIAKAAGIVGAFTFLSRILGFIRDVIVAKYFGAGLSADAFFVAFRIPNLLRRLLAEGSLTVSFVPVFTEYLTKNSKKDAFEVAHIAFTALSMILVAISILGILLAPLIIRIIAPGFDDIPEKLQLTILLTRIMFPYIFFIGLLALCMGILNSLGHFTAPSLAPVLLNISMIIGVLYLSRYFDRPVLGLAAGVIIGGISQLILQIPFLIKRGVVFKLNFNFSHPAIRKIGTLMLPAVFGTAVYQFNIFATTLIASLLPEGSISFLYYANRLVEFPLGIFAVALGTALLPVMSEQAARESFEDLIRSLSFALRLVFFFTIPAMVGLIVLRVPIISILFQRGEFDYQATLLTAEALFYYSIGLWAIAGVRIIVPTFFSLKDTRTPVKVAVLALLANIVLSIILAFPLGLRHGGLALATSISSIMNMSILLMILRKRLGSIGAKRILMSVFRISISSAVMGIAVYLFCHRIVWTTGSEIETKILTLGVSIVIGVVVYLLCSYLLKSEESYSFARIVRERVKRN